MTKGYPDNRMNRSIFVAMFTTARIKPTQNAKTTAQNLGSLCIRFPRARRAAPTACVRSAPIRKRETKGCAGAAQSPD